MEGTVTMSKKEMDRVGGFAASLDLYVMKRGARGNEKQAASPKESGP